MEEVRGLSSRSLGEYPRRAHSCILFTAFL